MSNNSKYKIRKGKAKKDTGVATLKNGYKIKEETRDELEKHDWQGPRNAPDSENTELWTTQDCKNKLFTGFRACSITQVVELWLLGEIVDTAPMATFTPEVMAAMHEKAFATNGSVVIVPIPEGTTLQ